MIRSRSDAVMRAIANIVLAIASFTCVLPFLFLIIGSFTDNAYILNYGYTFFPKEWSIEAWAYLRSMVGTLARAYGITLFTTAFGTVLSLAITAMLSYGLSRQGLPGRKIFTFFVLFTMLFNGGLVPTYTIYTQIFHIKNTIWAQIFPGLLMNGFYVILMRTYFRTNIPPSLLESARLDGASEFMTFRKIVLPLSLPMLATIGLMVGIMYWNSWQNGLYYLSEPTYYNIPNILNQILMNIQYLLSGAMGDYGGDMMRLPGNSVRMAIAVIGVVPILVLYPFFQKYFVKGITVGAVKE